MSDVFNGELVKIGKEGTMQQVNDIAEQIRHEPFHTFTNNCIIKSFKLKKECGKIGVKINVVLTLGIVELDRYGLRGYFPFFHAWTLYDHTRVEVARPLDVVSPWGTYDIDLRPIIGIWIG